MEAEFTSSKQLFLSMDKMKMRYSSLFGDYSRFSLSRNRK